jgi:hypothetical protein
LRDERVGKRRGASSPQDSESDVAAADMECVAAGTLDVGAVAQVLDHVVEFFGHSQLGGSDAALNPRPPLPLRSRFLSDASTVSSWADNAR